MEEILIKMSWRKLNSLLNSFLRSFYLMNSVGFQITKTMGQSCPCCINYISRSLVSPSSQKIILHLRRKRMTSIVVIYLTFTFSVYEGMTAAWKKGATYLKNIITKQKSFAVYMGIIEAQKGYFFIPCCI